MFGNRLGWGISAVIVILVGLLASLVYQIGQPSPATGWVGKTIQPITVPAGLDRIIPTATGVKNAGEFYRQAIADYRANPSAYDDMATAKAPNPAAAPGLRALLDGTACREMDLFRSDPQSIVNYEAEKEPLMALDRVAHTAMQVALHSDPATDARLFSAILLLGVKLHNERVVYAELATGEELVGIGCKGLKNLAHLAKDPAREQLVEEFDTQRLSANAAEIQPMWAVLSNVDMNTISAYSGDWFVLAKDKSIDPLWRTEGILKLGQLKYSAARLGDQKEAIRLLKQLAQDESDIPAVRAAAAAGRDLTIEGYRSLR
jgi:hypothetical protein